MKYTKDEPACAFGNELNLVCVRPRVARAGLFFGSDADEAAQ